MTRKASERWPTHLKGCACLKCFALWLQKKKVKA